MPPRKDKARQATVESPTGFTSGETGGEIVPSNNSNMASTALIPGFSKEQVTGLMAMFSAMLDAKLEQRLGRFDENRQQSDPVPSIEHPNPDQWESAVPASYEQPRVPVLRAEEVGYFDPEYQQEQGNTQGPVVNAGKYVYYRDVYIFVDRLKDLASQHDVKQLLSACLRGTALMWYSMELTELERDLLRDADLDRWYTTLINRFKIRTSAALAQLTSQSYSLTDIRHTSPRAWIQQMLYLSKSAGLDSVYNQLLVIWNRLAVSLRRDVPEPQPTTSIGQFLMDVDAKTDIWLELAQRQSQHRSYPPPGAQQPQLQPKNKYPPRQVTFEDRKGHANAYLAGGGYGEYEEDEAEQEQ